MGLKMPQMVRHQRLNGQNQLLLILDRSFPPDCLYGYDFPSNPSPAPSLYDC